MLFWFTLQRWHCRWDVIVRRSVLTWDDFSGEFAFTFCESRKVTFGVAAVAPVLSGLSRCWPFGAGSVLSTSLWFSVGPGAGWRQASLNRCPCTQNSKAACYACLLCEVLMFAAWWVKYEIYLRVKQKKQLLLFLNVTILQQLFEWKLSCIEMVSLSSRPQLQYVHMLTFTYLAIPVKLSA